MASAKDILTAGAAMLGIGDVKSEASKRGELLGLGHIANSIRDEEMYDDTLPAFAKAIGCTEDRVREVFKAIGQTAYKLARSL